MLKILQILSGPKGRSRYYLPSWLFGIFVFLPEMEDQPGRGTPRRFSQLVFSFVRSRHCCPFFPVGFSAFLRLENQAGEHPDLFFHLVFFFLRTLTPLPSAHFFLSGRAPSSGQAPRPQILLARDTIVPTVLEALPQ